jgi:hypothetical protein
MNMWRFGPLLGIEVETVGTNTEDRRHPERWAFRVRSATPTVAAARTVGTVCDSLPAATAAFGGLTLPPNAPIQRRAAERTVRCNRLSGSRRRGVVFTAGTAMRTLAGRRRCRILL